MILFPAIDIRNGKCVRLVQGDYSKENVYSDSPVDIAIQWEKQGAEYLHIVDLDGAKTGDSPNKEMIQTIAENSPIPVQVGGGIRSLAIIEAYISAGARRVIIGTAAITDKEFLQKAVDQYGDQIAVSIDARGGLVATNGWMETSNVKAMELAGDLEQIGVKTIIYTDILKDGMLGGPNFAELQAINEATSIKVIASGGIASIQDIDKLAALDLYGAIIGKALYDGTLSLPSLMEASNDAR
ncbi:1-(5-phosphoribosyl)-5-[(5-phosphoribosylamino)methylideneamino]imidazole-4-carboxamide isomerase [Virgibacillus dakarensis]|nr:1-(5-phosphoribosyl)-5-[(5-phosphoribosylamino)methylideneamino]imidazole-4-carboxamide isomerase [Virgibacillus dakarensis]MTW84612.1 1-(5-phosphoribosyl)-5-[(5-phosphoribosylamino)methylideneamino]imidazole-4-carboxamide isomerase [Virgibacillus dakarensis]